MVGFCRLTLLILGIGLSARRAFLTNHHTTKMANGTEAAVTQLGYNGLA